MLKTNSKKLREKINKYIALEFSSDYLESKDITDIKKYIYNCFISEKREQYLKGFYKSEYDCFKAWAQGLSGGGVFDNIYYFNYCNAVDIVGDLLEQTEEERNRYDNSQAAALLTYLIYKEVKSA